MCSEWFYLSKVDDQIDQDVALGLIIFQSQIADVYLWSMDYDLYVKEEGAL